MDTTLTKLMTNPYAWLVLVIVAFLSVIIGIIGIISAAKGRTKKEISYKLSSCRLFNKFEKSIEPLKILYNDNLVKDLSRTNIAFWNSGNATINREDIVSDCIIRGTDTCKILGADIFASIEEANDFKVDLDIVGNTATFDFKYVDRNQGIIIQIIHTGNSEQLKMEGKIKGGEIMNSERFRFKSKSKDNILDEFNQNLLFREDINLRSINNKIFKFSTVVFAIILIFNSIIVNLKYFDIISKVTFDSILNYGYDEPIFIIMLDLVTLFSIVFVGFIFSRNKKSVPKKLAKYFY